MQKYRIITRSLVLILMMALVYLNLYEKKIGQLGAEREIAESPILTAYNCILWDDNKPMLFRGDIEGGLWSLRIYGLSLTDPLAFVASSVTSLSLNSKLFLSILIPLLLILIFGRSFCAWVCPYSMFAETGNGIIKLLKKFGIEYFRFDLPNHSALLFLILSLIGGLILSIPLTILIYPPRIFTEAIYHIVIAGTISSGLIFLLFLWIGEIIFSPHLFCRRICPGGALMALLGRYRILRLKKNLSKCDMCGVCDPACPYLLTPSLGKFPGECDNCGLCIGACNKNNRNALSYVWKINSVDKKEVS